MENILIEITSKLTKLETEMARVPSEFATALSQIHPDRIVSAQNLIKYLVLRKTDIQELQNDLHHMGLSSLASCESHTHFQLQSTLERLGQEFEEKDQSTSKYGSDRICHTSEVLFGHTHQEWPSSIMVTMDSSFLEKKNLIRNLLRNGMAVARINCARDDEAVWEKMISKIREESAKEKIECKIHLDLAGPKLRVELLQKGKEAGKVKIKEGQTIWLAESKAGFTEDDVVISPGEKGVISALKIGERVFIDDGLIMAKVEKLQDKRARLKIERNSSKKSKIKAEKGINFPDSDLPISSLTSFDIACLPFVMSHADTVGFSFVRKASDLHKLREELEVFSNEIPPVILKIETKEAVDNLPQLLLEGMKHPHFGVMIARGDLAVEIGFERLVEIQEEISWLCEAAHTPVIWATQVLENLHKSGIASRAEITDAGRASMAECIMINKGDHTLKVLKTLREIAKRSRSLKLKSRLVFRELGIATNFIQGNISEE
ncbi:pyruvate kinase [Algoriphagus halophytocola]|uniref:Pyruvate kinase n=1 Tax=Algoriphagus halophytocola TaxID=2991499 RepID=A0ABY6MHG6_9BACT|nr:MULTISPECIES: pyruvate kinase [unclassified Algoriphagus]UZD23220.1 pyruvate kinase [Algoriphagus sp. TR-M5]WBL44513.1 pyruvate kinase [Algoriphagus sp. TR-M9]